MEKYQSRLAKGECCIDTKRKEASIICELHNDFDYESDKRGVGIAVIHSEVDNIRLEIQKYLESFNPFK